LDEMFYGAMDPMPDFNDVVPWPDARFLLLPREKPGSYVKAIPGRRFFKSHLLSESLPYYPELAMSLINARKPLVIRSRRVRKILVNCGMGG